MAVHFHCGVYSIKPVYIHLLQPGVSLHDSVKIPFSLAPQSQNEWQFAFTVEAVTSPQKVKGTLTYMLQVLHEI